MLVLIQVMLLATKVFVSRGGTIVMVSWGFQGSLISRSLWLCWQCLGMWKESWRYSRVSKIEAMWFKVFVVLVFLGEMSKNMDHHIVSLEYKVKTLQY